MMKFFSKFFLFCLFVGGWTLAASAVHVVRSPGSPQWLGKFSIMPKDKLTFEDTYVDVREWTQGDLTSHPLIDTRLSELNHRDLVAHIEKTTATNPLEAAHQPTVSDATPPPDTSIFNMRGGK